MVPADTWQVSFSFARLAYIGVLVTLGGAMPRVLHETAAVKQTICGASMRSYNLATPKERYTQYLLSA